MNTESEMFGNDITRINLKVTADAMRKILNLSNCSCRGLDGIPTENNVTISGNNIELIFQSAYNESLGKYWMQSLPQYTIESNGVSFNVPNGSSIFKGKLIVGCQDEMNLSISLNVIEQPALTDEHPHFWRYVYPVDTDEWFLQINAKPFRDDYGMVSCHGLLEIMLNSHKMRLYIKKLDDKHYMFIESMDRIIREDMDHSVDAIVISLGLITGKQYGNFRFMFATDDYEFNTLTGQGLMHLLKSKKCPYQIFDTNHTGVLEMLKRNDYQEYALEELKEENETESWHYDDQPMQDYVFAKLTQLCYEKNDIMIASSMLIQGCLMPIEYQKAFYHVVLETITSALMADDGFKAPPPMRTHDYQEKVLPKLLDTLNSIDDIPGAAKDIYIKRLTNSLNNPANQDKLIVLFEKCNYKLTENDHEAIKNRNKSFHGHLTDGKRDLYQQRNTFFAESLRLHKLCCILLLKAAGFKGQIFNNEVLFGIKEACERKEPPYIEI